MLIESWDEFFQQVEALFRAEPLRVMFFSRFNLAFGGFPWAQRMSRSSQVCPLLMIGLESKRREVGDSLALLDESWLHSELPGSAGSNR
eukprot:7378240-Pyramimonas_sp.AAC.2